LHHLLLLTVMQQLYACGLSACRLLLLPHPALCVPPDHQSAQLLQLRLALPRHVLLLHHLLWLAVMQQLIACGLSACCSLLLLPHPATSVLHPRPPAQQHLLHHALLLHHLLWLALLQQQYACGSSACHLLLLPHAAPSLLHSGPLALQQQQHALQQLHPHVLQWRHLPFLALLLSLHLQAGSLLLLLLLPPPAPCQAPPH
jgi:hypothetical protein